MTKDLINQLKEEKIIAIMRGVPADSGENIAEALLNGGVSFLEITLNTEGALQMISDLKTKYGDRLKIGAGTVLDVMMAKEAVSAGAEYIISPHLDEEVVKYGLENGLHVWPGTMTPTEVMRAHKLGAKAVKVFPIGSLGVNYIKEIRGPLNHIDMIATGGINLQNMNQVLQNGAMAVGLGGNLVNNQLVEQGRFQEITSIAKGFVDLVKEVGTVDAK
ncbi:bifunctional 4-hydroxy-2-oxoglutarate aldolase/2-dehydro-3-deoxy-phosphogluconate aldolase [Bacillus sp. AK128]